MTETELQAELDRLVLVVRLVEQERDAAQRLWAEATQDRDRFENENRALRVELAMCPESRVEMAAWQPDCTSDLDYLDAPRVDLPASAWRWAIGLSALFWLVGGWALWSVLT